MDDFEEYRKRHREAYQRRRGGSFGNSGSSDPSSGSADASKPSSLFGKTTMDVDKSSDLFGGSNDAEKSSDLFGGSNMGSGTSSDLFGEPTTSTDKSAAWQYHQPSVACRSSSSSFSADTVQSALHTNSPSLAAVDPRMGDPEYESSVELARKLQDEFDRCARADADAESVRRPDESYTECLLPDVPQGAQFDQSDVDLQRAIAKSLIDM